MSTKSSQIAAPIKTRTSLFGSARRSLTVDFAGYGYRCIGIGLLIIMLAMLSSCEEGCLCEPQNGKSMVFLSVDWSGYNHSKPSGMSIYLYNRGIIGVNKILTHDLEKCQTLLTPGDYDILCISHSEIEYGQIKFEDMDSFEDAKAVGVRQSAPTWAPEIDNVIAEPDRIASGTLSCSVTGEGHLPHCYCPQCNCLQSSITPEILGPIASTSLTYTTEITVEIDGTENILKIRGAIQGTSNGVNIHDRRQLGYEASQLLTQWTGTNTTFQVFGLSETPELLLQFLLHDETTIVEHKITHFKSFVIDDDTRKISIVIAIDEPLPNVRPNSSGGFDADVDDWEEDSKIEIELN